jgi:dihydrofolate reductase
VHAVPDGDTVFPAIDPAAWRETRRSAHAPGPGDDTGYDAVTYVRIRPETAVRDASAR